jgi:rhodanese-related sulfurtransferase
MWRRFTLALSIIPLCASFSLGQQIPYTSDSMATIKQKVESNEAILLDVREPTEWNAGHAKMAVSLPMSVVKKEAKRTEVLAQLDKSKPIYCHCMVGGRAMKFARMVQGTGLDVRPMKQKFEEISTSGLEMVRESAP